MAVNYYTVAVLAAFREYHSAMESGAGWRKAEERALTRFQDSCERIDELARRYDTPCVCHRRH